MAGQNLNTEQIGSEIAAARIEKNISIEALAETTRISAEYLQKIEQGEFDFLPRPYVIAYIKTYAEKIGLSGDALIKKWEKAESQSAETESVSAAETEDMVRDEQIKPPVAREKAAEASGLRKADKNKHIKEFSVGASVIAVLAFIFYIANYSVQNESTQSNDTQNESDEIPISAMIAENEARMDSIAAAIPEVILSSKEAAQPFILRLEVSDTVWVRLVVDGVDSNEFTYMPGNSRTWQANEFFIVR
ncbi:MAG: helix-turn-helix domain-containing protein, partial [bacterium]